MKSTTTLTALALAGALGAGAMSYYATDVRQQRTLTRIEQRRQLARLQHQQADSLLVVQAASADAANTALTRWKSRYKYIPQTLNTADMVEYLEGLTRTGFEQFDLFLVGRTDHKDFSVYSWKVEGTGSFSDLYHLIWHLENNRAFYRLQGLEVKHVNVFKRNRRTDLERRYDMVAFSFTLNAYFDGLEGISAPEDDLRLIPLATLQAHRPADDSFTPIVRTDLPPNDERLLDAENAKLLAITGSQAIFEDPNGRHVVFEGDRIYLGEILLIDPVNSFVRVRLNKGDRVETVNIRIGEREGYRQALDDGVQLRPITPTPNE